MRVELGNYELILPQNLKEYIIGAPFMIPWIIYLKITQRGDETENYSKEPLESPNGKSAGLDLGLVLSFVLALK